MDVCLKFVAVMVLLPASCALLWVVFLRGFLNNTALVVRCRTVFDPAVSFMFVVVTVDLCLFTFIWTLNPFKAFVVAPLLGSFLVYPACVKFSALGWEQTEPRNRREILTLGLAAAVRQGRLERLEAQKWRAAEHRAARRAWRQRVNGRFVLMPPRRSADADPRD